MKKKNKKINFENKKKETEKVIHNYITNAFKNNEELSEKFINDYIKIFFINLIDDPFSDNNPAFGINEVLSSFKELVPNENWEKLEKSCYNKNLKEYEEYCKKNIFLKNYFDFEIIKKKNKEIAENYLFELETGAFFTGILPGADIGMEYYYRNLFKDKLKSIYGFDYEEAERESISLNNKLIINDDENSSFIEKKSEKNIKKMKEIDNKIDKEVGNVKRNLFSIGKGLLTVGSIGVRAMGSIGVRAISIGFLPVSCIFGAIISPISISIDGEKMIKIFEEAYASLKFKTLLNYIEKTKEAINNLDSLGYTIKQKNEMKNEEEE